MKKLQEIPLRDHGDLCKLRRVHSHDLCDLLIGLPLLSPVCITVWKDQLHPGRLLHVSGRTVCIPSLPKTQILWIPADRIALTPVRKGKLHISIHLLRGILAAHHIAVSLPAARLIVQGIGDRVEHRRLARSRIPGDQEQSLLYI